MRCQLAEVFNKPHRSRAREANFCAVLVESLGARHVANDYPPTPEALRKPVSSSELIKSLEADRFLPPVRRYRCIDHLKALPEQIVVALDPRRISFDFVIRRGENTYYMEFHEQQHCKLTVDRPEPVYDPSGLEYRVPRFLQRLIRDVWRVQSFPDFTIVWHDWFTRHRDSYVPELAPGFTEYHLQGTFSFRSFLGLDGDL